MQEDVEVMEPNNLEGRSRGSSFRRRALTLVGVSALTLSGAGAALFGASQAFAFASIPSNPYTIGTVVSGGLSFSPSNTAENASGVTYNFSFTVPSGESGSSVALTNLPGTTAVISAIVTAGGVTTTDVTAPSSNAATVTTSSLTAGESVSIQITGFTNDASLVSNPYTVTASVASLVAATTSFSLTAAPSGPSVTVTPTTPSYAGSSVALSNFTGISGNTLYLGVSGGVAFNGTANVANEYSVTYTTAGSTVQQTASVTNSTAATTIGGSAGTSTVTLTLGTILSSTSTVSVVANGVTNGGASGTSYGSVSSTAFVAAPASPSPSFNIGKALGAVSLTVNPNTAGASNAVYGVSFAIPSGTGANPALTTTFSDNNGVSVPLGGGWALFDSTNPAVNTSATTGAASVTMTGVASGDSVTVDYYGMTNSTNTSVTGKVSMTGFSIPVKTNTVSYSGASSSSSAVNVAVSNPVVSGTSTYTVSGLVAGGSGVNNAGGTIVLDFSTTSTTTTLQTGLVLPATSVNYTLTDLTNSSSSGLTTVSVTAGVANVTPTSVEITTKNAITAGDQLLITITGVQNPSVAATNEYVTADTAGSLPLTTGAVAPTAAPNAAVTGSNGALVNVNGTIYVYAGGIAFGIPTVADFNSISAELGSPTVVTASSVTTSGTVRNGTLLQVVGSPEIGVVNSGTYTGFSTASQFLADGYSFANVIQVPNLGSLTTGTGTPPNAAATASDGALVNVSGTIYVYAGGLAVGIPTPAVFNTISAAEGNPTVVTATSVTTTGTMATGTLVQVVGSAQINVVTSTGTQVGFATASEFTGDGYSWGKVILIP